MGKENDYLNYIIICNILLNNHTIYNINFKCLYFFYYNKCFTTTV